MNEPVKRYAMPIISGGRLAAPVEAEQGYWMLFADYVRDIQTRDDRIAELEFACAGVIDVAKGTQFQRPVSENLVSDAMTEIVNRVAEHTETITRLRDGLENAKGYLHTISKRAGFDEYLHEMQSVRGYANSGFTVASAALEGEK